MENKNHFGRALARKLGQEHIPDVTDIHEPGASLLMNPSRMTIFLELCRAPGHSLRMLSRAMHMNQVSVMRLVDGMEAERLVASGRFRNRRILYTPLLLTKKEAIVASIFNESHLAESIKAFDEPVRLAEAARNMRVTMQTANPRIRVLVEAGMVKKTPQGYVSTNQDALILEKARKNKAQNEKKMMELLEKQNLAPSKGKSLKDRMTATVTLGKDRKTITLYLIPQNIPPTKERNTHKAEVAKPGLRR